MQIGKKKICLVLRISLLLLFILSTSSCEKTELRIANKFDFYTPSHRVGVKKIKIERSRVVRYFGFKDITSFSSRLDLDEVVQRRGRRDRVNQITLEIERGEIKDVRTTGTTSIEVDQYVKNIVESWKSEQGSRFTEFIDRVKVVLQVDQGGTIEVKFLDIEVSQPETENEKFRFFNTVSRDAGKMCYLFPYRGFEISNVNTAEKAAEAFGALDAEFKKWKAM